MTDQPAPDSTAPVPAPDAPADEPQYGWLFLVGLAAIVVFIDPLVVDLRPRTDLSIGILIAGAALLGFGQMQGRLAAWWAGAGVLWAGIAAGIASQPAPL